jgi:hypothetical protein
MTIAMTPIYTQTVGSGGVASITFNNIPQTFTDLKIVISARGSRSNGWDALGFRINGSTTGYSDRDLLGTGSAAASFNNALSGYGFVGDINAASYTASTFGNLELYIPNYTGSSNKSYIADSVVENNGTASIMELTSGLWSNTSAITSLLFSAYIANLVQHSTFSLYGITKG